MSKTLTGYPHTPEPWAYVYGAAYQGTEDDVIEGEASSIPERAPARLLLADRNDDRTRPVERDANLRRAVQCVNACAGMADPAADLARLRKIAAWACALVADIDGGDSVNLTDALDTVRPLLSFEED